MPFAGSDVQFDREFCKNHLPSPGITDVSIFPPRPPSALYPVVRALNRDLALWAMRKYKKLRRHLRRATHWIDRISRRAPGLFALWQLGARRGSVMGAV
jgi:hypothetical protein